MRRKLQKVSKYYIQYIPEQLDDYMTPMKLMKIRGETRYLAIAVCAGTRF